MDIEKIKQAFVDNTLLTMDDLKSLPDEVIVSLNETVDKHPRGKDVGYKFVALIVGLKMEGFDQDDSLSILKELTVKPDEYKDNDENLDWLIQKHKLGIK